MANTPRKAIALISGGLDSMLAAKAIQAQGIHVEGLNFFTGFCVEGHTHAIRQKDKTKQKRNNALWVAEQLGIPLHIIDVVDEYKDVLLNPKFGYGSHLNPCLDCKVFMIRKAKEWMVENHFDFIITGEVIGQRPKSQKKSNMPTIAKYSGANELLVRPLCAQFLPPTFPELQGWISREKLYGFTGRSRKPQIELAKEFQINEYAQPAGGCCFLTDKNYSEKLLDLWQSHGHKQYELDDILLLKVGRHLRPAPHFKMIIGREKGENNYLKGYLKEFDSLSSVSHMGPLMLIDGSPTLEDIHLCARVLGRYSDCPTLDPFIVNYRNIQGITLELNVTPFSSEEIPLNWQVGTEHKNPANVGSQSQRALKIKVLHE